MQRKHKIRKPSSGIELATHDSWAHGSHSRRALLCCGGKCALGFAHLSNSSSLTTVVAAAAPVTTTHSLFLPGHTARLHVFPSLLCTGPRKPGPSSLPSMLLLLFFSLWVRKLRTVITQASEAGREMAQPLSNLA